MKANTVQDLFNVALIQMDAKHGPMDPKVRQVCFEWFVGGAIAALKVAKDNRGTEELALDLMRITASGWKES